MPRDSVIDEFEHWNHVEALIIKDLKRIKTLVYYLRGDGRGYVIDALRELANDVEKPLLKEMMKFKRIKPAVSPKPSPTMEKEDRCVLL